MRKIVKTDFKRTIFAIMALFVNGFAMVQLPHEDLSSCIIDDTFLIASFLNGASFRLFGKTTSMIQKLEMEAGKLPGMLISGLYMDTDGIFHRLELVQKELDLILREIEAGQIESGSRNAWTSSLTSIDPEHMLVKTRSSVYKIEAFSK